MSIYTYLQKDHADVKQQMQEIEGLAQNETTLKDDLFNELKTKIIMHSKAEEKVFYAELAKKASLRKQITHAKKEHKEVEDMLQRLSASDLKGAAWMQLFKHLAQNLLHHIKEEEQEIFPKAQQELSDKVANDMEHAMKKEKERLMETVKIKRRA